MKKNYIILASSLIALLSSCNGGSALKSRNFHNLKDGYGEELTKEAFVAAAKEKFNHFTNENQTKSYEFIRHNVFDYSYDYVSKTKYDAEEHSFINQQTYGDYEQDNLVSERYMARSYSSSNINRIESDISDAYSKTQYQAEDEKSYVIYVDENKYEERDAKKQEDGKYFSAYFSYYLSFIDLAPFLDNNANQGIYMIKYYENYKEDVASCFHYYKNENMFTVTYENYDAEKLCLNKYVAQYVIEEKSVELLLIQTVKNTEGNEEFACEINSQDYFKMTSKDVKVNKIDRSKMVDVDTL